MFYLWLGLRDLFQLFICWYLQMLWCSYICVIYKPVVFSKFTHLWKWKIFLVHLLAMSLNKISKYTHYQLLYLIFIRNLFFVSNEVIICFPNMCVCEFINFLSSIQNKKKQNTHALHNRVTILQRNPKKSRAINVHCALHSSFLLIVKTTQSKTR